MIRWRTHLYTLGHNARGENEAFVVARFPYVMCPRCETSHALFYIWDDSYSCLLCAATRNGRTAQ